MNQDLIHSIRLQVAGTLKQQWGRLTGNAPMIASGTDDRFAGRILEQRASSSREADRQLRDFMHRNRNWWDLSGR